MSRRKGRGTSFIANGVRNDCHTLLERFKLKKSTKFSTFVDIWREMYFPYIFLGRSTFAELWELTEEIILAAKTFMFEPYPHLTRIGALYLTYSVYMRQPTQKLVKVRITHEEFKSMAQFMDRYIIPAKIFEAYYIFSKMVYEEAFAYVVKSREYGLERKYRKYFSKEAVEALSQKQTNLDQVFEDEIWNHMAALEQRYHHMKCVLQDPGSDKPPQVLNYASSSIANELKKMVNSVSATVTSTYTSDEGEESGTEDIGIHRQSIKMKAFSNQASFRNVENTEEQVEDIPEVRARKTRSCISKKRVNFCEDVFENSESDEYSDDEGRCVMDMPEISDSEKDSQRKEADDISDEEFQKRLDELKEKLFSSKFDIPSQKAKGSQKGKKRAVTKTPRKVTIKEDGFHSEDEDLKGIPTSIKSVEPKKGTRGRKKIVKSMADVESELSEDELQDADESASKIKNEQKVALKQPAKRGRKKKIISCSEDMACEGNVGDGQVNMDEEFAHLETHDVGSGSLEGEKTENGVKPAKRGRKKKLPIKTELQNKNIKEECAEANSEVIIISDERGGNEDVPEGTNESAYSEMEACAEEMFVRE